MLWINGKRKLATDIFVLLGQKCVNENKNLMTQKTGKSKEIERKKKSWEIVQIIKSQIERLGMGYQSKSKHKELKYEEKWKIWWEIEQFIKFCIQWTGMGYQSKTEDINNWNMKKKLENKGLKYEQKWKNGGKLTKL